MKNQEIANTPYLKMKYFENDTFSKIVLGKKDAYFFNKK